MEDVLHAISTNCFLKELKRINLHVKTNLNENVSRGVTKVIRKDNVRQENIQSNASNICS